MSDHLANNPLLARVLESFARVLPHGVVTAMTQIALACTETDSADLDLVYTFKALRLIIRLIGIANLASLVLKVLLYRLGVSYAPLSIGIVSFLIWFVGFMTIVESGLFAWAPA
ncbi:hypothetical protein PHISP_07919 [Aspergillus sp. HF37]|nr:hypothetical protein PHISP_07919 [Aspergillus sp. HF37]